MTNLQKRLLTGIIGGTVVGLGIIFTHYGVWLFGLIVSMVSIWEFFKGMGILTPAYKRALFILGAVIWGLVLFDIEDRFLLAAMLLILPTFEIISLINFQETQPHKQLGLATLGFVYCFVPLLLFYKISKPDTFTTYDYRLPLGILFLIWSLDTTAYFIGKSLGKNLLFPRISPKKTWEGTLGGTLGCLLTGILLANLMPVDRFIYFKCHWPAAAIIVSVFSQLGDLVESMYKRSVALKDSGNILPGHGGMLDRFDGFFLAIPFLYLYFLLL